jgi:phosphatidate phosphatase APP1
MLVRNPNKRKPVKGMPYFFDKIKETYKDEDPFFIYVSSSPWNVEPTIRRFIKTNNYGEGPIIARDWGPAENALFVWGSTHKYREIKKIMSFFQDVSWILVGDDGQKDPALYKRIVDENPNNVEAVVIRQLSASEQIFAHWLPTPYSTTAGILLPVYYGPDGYNLSEQLSRNKREK